MRFLAWSCVVLNIVSAIVVGCSGESPAFSLVTAGLVALSLQLTREEQ